MSTHYYKASHLLAYFMMVLTILMFAWIYWHLFTIIIQQLPLTFETYFGAHRFH